MEMFNYYTLDECIDKSSVFEKLELLKDDGKIIFSVEGEILKLEDIDLEDFDIEDLQIIFDKNDVFPYLDREDDEDDFDNFYDEEQDDY